MEEKEQENIYSIPANYTDSGKILGGLLAVRNVIESVILVALIAFAEVKLLPIEDTARIVVMVVTLLPLGIVSLIGIEGDSLLQYFGYIVHFLFRRRKLHFQEKKI